MRRDNFNIIQNEYVTVLLDTFYDRRNGIMVTVNPIGGRMDGQVTDERVESYNADWNPIWEVEPGRFEQGWTFEAAIPFKSLRYRPGTAQVWGVNVNRRVRWEERNLVSRTRSCGPGTSRHLPGSLAATLVGLEAPDTSRTLELKPFAITDLSSDRNAVPEVSNAWGRRGARCQVRRHAKPRRRPHG